MCEPIGRDNPPKSGSLTLKCKNFMVRISFPFKLISFQLVVFEVPNYEECQLAAETIEVLSNISESTLNRCLQWISAECVHDYPFFYRCPFQILDNGWNAFDVEQEYARLTLLAGDSYRISSVNENFQVSLPCCRLLFTCLGLPYLSWEGNRAEGNWRWLSENQRHVPWRRTFSGYQLLPQRNKGVFS